jgi:hypothetical protein
LAQDGLHTSVVLVNSVNGVAYQRRATTGEVRVWVNGVGMAVGGTAPLDTDMVVAMTYSPTATRSFLNGAALATGGGATPNLSAGLLQLTYATHSGTIFYGEVLSDVEIARIGAMTGAWTWSNLTSRLVSPVFTVGSSHIGPMRVGKA